ncbi:MAG: hypothetical protein JWO84_306 [Parcubacteria group bacterium]|nr:hypothetical protein [Parcubacteria group bacterium]
MIDVVVGSALILLIFLSLTSLLRASLLVSSLAKAKAGATAVANTQMEYIRSLPYDSVGTVGGIPAGTIPQTATTTENSIPYGVRTFIEYVDDPADGTGAADTNSITTDYKRIKVAVTYTVHQKLREVDLVSNYTPASIETTTGGGTLKVQVVNRSGVGVAGATVHVVNTSTSPAVDVTTFSDATGVVLLGGAATSTQYQVFVSKNGYSSTQTYARDVTNQNPTPGYLTVVKNTTTTGTFPIDLLASLTLGTYYPVQATSTIDTFANSTKLASQTGTAVTGGSLSLAQDVNGYLASGSAQSISISPALLVSWTTASTTLSAPAGTTVTVQVLDGSGALLPDAVLAGNSAGFFGSSINLSGVSTTTYPSLALRANLTTTSTSTSPAVATWSVNSLVGPIPIPNVALALAGAKTIGSTGAGAPIYKTSVAATTNASGIAALSLEWDSYSLSLTGYDIVDACYAAPYALLPGTNTTNNLFLDVNTSNSALVSVRDSSGATVAGATVTVSKAGFTQDSVTSACGAAYFGALASGAYTVTITKAGYTTTSYPNVTVAGDTFYPTSFP